MCIYIYIYIYIYICISPENFDLKRGGGSGIFRNGGWRLSLKWEVLTLLQTMAE